MSVSFINFNESVTSNEVQADISLPLGAVTSDAKVTFSVLATASVSQTPPSAYSYFEVFDLDSR